MSRHLAWLGVVLAVGLLAAAEAADLGLTIHRIDVDRFPNVRAYVSVADEHGVPITGIEGKDFELLEDGKPVERVQVEAIVENQEPIAVALVIDVSGSMADANKMTGAKQAASAFVSTMGPKDAVALVSFADEVKIVQGFTADQKLLGDGINSLQPKGDTVLYDAVGQSAQILGALTQQRRVLLILTDGEDTKSKRSLDAAIGVVKGAGAPVFAVGLGKDVSRPSLDKLVAGTGGQAFYPEAADQLRPVFLSIGNQLRRQYVLQYTSALPGDDKTHTMTVKTKYRGLAAEAPAPFTAKRTPLTFTVNGLVNAESISGQRRIEVAVTGPAQQAELLVDGQSKATASAAPFVFQWDTTKETPGLKKVVVRVRDVTGVATEKEFGVQVAGAAVATATPAAAPTAPPVTVAVPTPVPTVAPTPTPAITSVSTGLVAAAVGLVLLAGAAVLFLLGAFGRRERPAPPPPPPRGADLTDVVGAPTMGVLNPDATMPGATPPPPPPKARLLIKQNGSERPEALDKPKTSIGRGTDSDIVLPDPTQKVSRVHASIALEDGVYWIVDTSINGTWVNDKRIEREVRHKLASKDQIKIGDAVMTLIIGNE